MITYADVERLRSVRTDDRSVLSLYLRVPADPAELRELWARAHGIVETATGPGGELSGSVLADDEQRARKLLETHGRDWLGHTAAIFVGGQDGGRGGLSEAVSLPCELPDRAVLAERPQIRSLLVALQRCPVHYVVIVDQRHAWLFRVSGDQVESTGATTEQPQVRSRGFSGWYGLESHRINDRIVELAHEHFEATVSLLERVMRPDGQEPMVVGGHEETIPQFTSMLPNGLAERLAGSFVVDPHTMTPARVRDLARPVIDDWVGMHEQRLTVELREAQGPHDPLTVAGLSQCLAAVNQRAVHTLIVPVGGVISGYACARCGALSSTPGGECTDGPDAARLVPDLFEEMVTRTLDEGGRTEAISDPPGDVAARLRFPVVHAHGR